MIRVESIKVEYDTFLLSLKAFEIPKDKITFILGKNGTGKTTLLKSIANLIPFKGIIHLDGVVTYSSQEPVIFNMTAMENILYPIKIRKLNPDLYIDKIEEYSKLLEISELLDHNATKFSSGEKMKVAIIRSIIFHPDYVLLDEPTTHLDIDSIDELTKLIKKLKNEITFVIVSHNKQFMDELKEHAVILEA